MPKRYDVNHDPNDTMSINSIEDVFRQMSDAIPQFAGLSLSRIGDLGVQILSVEAPPW